MFTPLRNGTPVGQHAPPAQPTGWYSWISRHRLAIRGILALYWMALFIGTHLPRVPSALEHVSDKTLHFLAYAGLAFWLVLDSLARGHWTPRRHATLLIVCFLYSILDELLQIPVGRSADLLDGLADLEGISSVLLISLLAYYFQPRSPRTKL